MGPPLVAALLPAGGAGSSLPAAVLLGAVILSAALAALVYLLANGRLRARRQAQAATAELRAAERDSRQHAGLLAAIMASLGDGVGVVDRDGAFLLHNPAAKALLGIDGDAAGPADWQQHYGLFLPDGRTPFPLAEMPLMRALSGESCNGVEMMIRNRDRPDGVLISIDGRPLVVDGDRRGAVAVFHDITELRRHETDLAVFAGVVAHDLKAPLAVVRGHCEAAAEDLADLPVTGGVLTVREALGRIAVGVDRMGGLIDTLLAYTTARDAPLRLRPTALGPLVGDVIAERLGSSRHAAGVVPEIYVGPLPEVEADPAMLRHVFDNLIGNALKYVRPGQAAHIDVTGAPGAPGWARIEVADRGIGIPDAEKPHVFETFHQAHAGAGYDGTGLGLAICRRVVERHGGAIDVADNPGGGTRFPFTLPLAGATPSASPTRPEAVMDPAFAGSAPADLAPAVPVAAGSVAAVPVAAGSVAAGSVPAGPVPVAATASRAGGAEPEATRAKRAALERALAERAAIQRAALPGLSALPSATPSARESSAARLRAPVPDHHHLA